MEFDLQSLNNKDRYKLLTSTIIPRPIALVSTVDEPDIDPRRLPPHTASVALKAQHARFMRMGERRRGPQPEIANTTTFGEHHDVLIRALRESNVGYGSARSFRCDESRISEQIGQHELATHV